MFNDTNDSDEVFVRIAHVIPHPNFIYSFTSGFPNDVGLLYLTEPVSYTDTILPICLPSPDVNTDQFKVCVDTGFGRTSRYGSLVFRLYYTTAESTPTIQRSCFYM